MMPRLIYLMMMTLALASGAIAQRTVAKTSFEDLPGGEVTAISTAIGRWTADAGHAAIDPKRHRTGKQCLHIAGGKARRIVLEPKLGNARVHEITFWAERWTRRDPFEFRVEVLTAARWREVYRGDQAIAIGGFKTHVKIPISDRFEKLRFTCTSPAGVLIDDLRLGRATPMEVTSITTIQRVVPCLVGNPRNRVAQIEIETMGGLQPIGLREVRINLEGTTDLEDITAVEILRADGTRFGRRQAPKKKIVFRDDCELLEGGNSLSISVEMSKDADIDHLVDAGCDLVRFKNGKTVVPLIANPRGALRAGTALRRAGDDGAAVHRIPAITTTNAGTLIAVYDLRWRGRGDLPGDIDVGMSRSTDGGRKWEPMKVVLDMGDDAKFRHDGVGDPAILFDRKKGTIWVAATWSHGNRAWRGSGPGLTPDETGQLMLVRSDDDGRTWSKPINITEQVKKPEWCYLLQGPGRGICMRDGTLVFAAQYQGAKRIPYSTILYSRDHGATWQLGTAARTNTTEAQVAELTDGKLMLNMRDNRGGSRSVYTSTDLGKTWAQHPTSRHALIEPVCNAALIRAGKRKLLFVNPAVSTAPRRRMTIRASTDLGATWPEDLQLLLDEGQSAGYPSATMIDDQFVGLLFEGSNAQLTFMRLRIADIKRR